jgi:hypothetical protein
VGPEKIHLTIYMTDFTQLVNPRFPDGYFNAGRRTKLTVAKKPHSPFDSFPKGFSFLSGSNMKCKGYRLEKNNRL